MQNTRQGMYRVAAVVVALLVLGMSAFAGGGERKGSAGADELLIPVGARSTALGGSYIAGISGAEAIYWNPAGLSASTRSAEVLFSHMTYFGETSVSYLALGANFSGFGHLGLSIKTLGFGNISLTDERAPDGGTATFSPTYVTFAVTYSRALTDRIRAGVNVNLVTEQISRSSASGVAFDAGIQYNGLVGMKGLQLGVALRHLGPNMKFDGPDFYRLAQEQDGNRDPQFLKLETMSFQLPTTLELGVAYTGQLAENHMVTLSGMFQNNNFLDDQWVLGLEYGFQNVFYLRGSYSMAPEASDDPLGESSYLYGLAFGAGVNVDAGGMALGFDYAYRQVGFFSANHMVTLTIGF